MKRFSSFISAALSVLLLLVSVMPASAATSATASSPQQSSGLSIEPRKNYTINPGQSVTDKLTIGNLDTAETLNLSMRVIDFTYSDQSGTPKLFLAQNAPQTAWSIKPFTTLPKSVAIGPGQSQSISYRVTVPKNVGAGSYYGAILYQTGTGLGGNVGLGASGVTLVFVTVPGSVNENLQLKKFGAYASDNSGVTGGYVYVATSAPQMIAYTIQNSGNVIEAPAGTITLKNMFGHQIKTLTSANRTQALALIGQQRLFSSCIESKLAAVTQLGGTTTDPTAAGACVTPHLMPGLYTAKLDLYYGQNGNTTHEITATAHFWYLPFWLLVVLLIVLALIVFGVWWLQRKIRAVIKGTTYHSGRGISRKR